MTTSPSEPVDNPQLPDESLDSEPVAPSSGDDSAVNPSGDGTDQAMHDDRSHDADSDVDGTSR